MLKKSRSIRRLLAKLLTMACGIVALAYSGAGLSAMLIENAATPYATFRGVDFVRHTGRFIGTTSKGDFRVPYEIIAPADPRRSNGKLVFEPPHFLFGAEGRDSTLGPALLFARRYSHATVGFSNNNFNLLDPLAADAMIAGRPVIANVPPILRDVEILAQFVEALAIDPYAAEALGSIRHRYAYGVSQSAEAIYELQYSSGIPELFDLTVLHVPLWRPPFAAPDVLNALPPTFSALPDVGKMLLISSEGDLLISSSLQLRNAVTGSGANNNYRLYEVAGAPHFAQDAIVDGVQLNPLAVSPVVRAAFVAGDRWVRRGRHPPDSRLLDAAAEGAIDPIYLIETGIARDTDGNAKGGVRFPDVENGRALHIASALEVEIVPGLAGLIGLWFDLACAPPPGADSGPRFARRAHYLRSVIRQTIRLRREGFLLPSDGRELIRTAIESNVGSADYCNS